MSQNTPLKFTVAVPFLSNEYRFTIVKKNGWSIIDYLFLKELCYKEMTLIELSSKSNLEGKIVLQILLPMCDVGWISIENVIDGLIFKVTDLGKDTYLSSEDKHELPFQTKTYQSIREIHVDDFENYYNFFNSNIQLYTYTRYQEFCKESEDKIVELQLQSSSIYPNYTEIEKIAQNHNEIIERVEDLNLISLETKKYLLVEAMYTEESGTQIIDKLPDVLSQKLIKKIKKILPSSLENSKIDTVVSNKITSHSDFFQVLHRDNVEFIYGGLEAKDKFLELIECSQNFLIIHSTFILKSNIEKEGVYTVYFQAIKEALERGVFVYILWGKTSLENYEEGYDIVSKEKDDSVKQSLTEFNNYCKKQRLTNLVNYNDFLRTESHAKFIITEHSNKGVCTMLSSCNFLFSQFNRFEASIVIYDNNFAKHFLNISAKLSSGKNTFNSSVRKEIRSYANSLEKSVIKELSEKDKLSIKLVLKNQHYHYIDLAKTEAKQVIYITSDFINRIPERPIYDALEYSDIQKKYLFYSTKSPYIEHSELDKTTNRLDALDKPIKLKKSQNTMHAKVLAWDNNNVVITSLNWLSSNASVTGDEAFHEIGVHVKGWNVAKDFIKKLRPVVKNNAEK